MRLLADENFPRVLVEQLRSAGHDVVWARTDCPGSRDTDLLERAETEARVVLTLDKDFWQIAMQRRAPLERSGVVLFRAHPAIPSAIEPLLGLFLAAAKPWAGHISLIAADGIRMLTSRRR